MRCKYWLIAGFCLFFAPSVKATQSNQFITIVNPVRISSYNPDPESSLRAEYSQVHKLNFPATWLLTYDILNNPQAVAELRRFDSLQEMGIFLEVTQNFAKSARVLYHNSGDWHYANSVFLSGYTPPERARLIDAVFTKFKSVFGYFPASIGSWWTDSYSLNYIKAKYGVVANLGLADQYKTDGYQVWGQYWSTPYYPSINHPAVPAGSVANKLDLVTIQWAPRDPYRGYLDSLYSTQDYFTTPNLGIDYFTKLVRLYAQKHDNQFGQVTVGLEGDFPANTYAGEYAKQLAVIKQLVSTGEFSTVTMRQFSDWYRHKFTGISPPHLITTVDLLGDPIKVIWYQTPKYRIGLVNDKLIDLRFYSDILVDPYRDEGNGDRDLFINIPAIDITGQVVEDKIDFDKIARKYYQPPLQELVFKDFSPRVPYALRSRLGNISNTNSVIIMTLCVIILFKYIRQSRIIIFVMLGIYLIYFNRHLYFVSQSELDALAHLATLPKGKVMVYDKDCLRCIWLTANQPAVLANKRGYIEKLSQHKVVSSNSLLIARDSGEGKLIFKKNHIRYLYLAKYGEYIETTHFPVGDLNLTKVYENANAAVWRFNEDFD